MKYSELISHALGLVSAVNPSSPSTAKPEKVNYDGYQIVRLEAQQESGSIKEKLGNLNYLSLNLDTDKHLDLALAPDAIDAFKALNLGGKVLHEDLGEDLKSEGELGTYQILRVTDSGDSGSRRISNSSSLPSLDWYESYHHYDDHVEYLRDLQAAFADHSEIITTGESFEGRPIQGIHLWGSGGKNANPAVLWHGTVHAREWITPKTTEYLTYQLIAGYLNGTEEVTDVLDKFDFYVFPVVNPDGFVFSYETDRLWRKNRQVRDGADCVGTDINRNWAYEWAYPGPGYECTEVYQGEEAGDTPEMEGLAGFVDQLAEGGSIGNGISLYIDWHSFGQYLLLPYGYNCSARADNHEYQMGLAEQYAGVIEEFDGAKYTYGPSCETLYSTQGASVDYVRGVAGADVAWTVELPPETLDDGGFVWPSKNILPTVQQQWEAMRWLLAEL